MKTMSVEGLDAISQYSLLLQIQFLTKHNIQWSSASPLAENSLNSTGCYSVTQEKLIANLYV